MTHLLFAAHRFYPKGGVSDLVARGTVDELKAYFQENAEEIADGSYIDNWGQIVRADTMEIVLIGEVEHVGGVNTSKLVAPRYQTAKQAKWSEPDADH